MKLLIPVLLALLGTGAGVGGGLMLRPAPEPAAEAHATETESPAVTPDAHDAADAHGTSDGAANVEFVKMNNQFVIPDIMDGRVAAMVVLSLSLEANIGSREGIYAREPKLRDAFLQVMFDHANAGGFRGAFTDSARMTSLRRALLEAARKTLGTMISDVLIIEIVRQDV